MLWSNLGFCIVYLCVFVFIYDRSVCGSALAVLFLGRARCSMCMFVFLVPVCLIYKQDLTKGENRDRCPLVT